MSSDAGRGEPLGWSRLYVSAKRTKLRCAEEYDERV